MCSWILGNTFWLFQELEQGKDWYRNGFCFRMIPEMDFDFVFDNNDGSNPGYSFIIAREVSTGLS